MKPILCSPHMLRPNPWNTNRVDPDNMDKLIRSIRDLGFVTSVVARELPDGTLEILGGQHRVEAAVEIGLKEIPVINLGVKSDAEAKKIGLVDNSRYGSDDVLALAELLEELSLDREELSAFLPMDDDEMEQIYGAVNVNLDDLGIMGDDEEEEKAEEEGSGRVDRPVKTHTNMRYRVTNSDAEAIAKVIERTIREENINEGDEASNAGAALAALILGKSVSDD